MKKRLTIEISETINKEIEDLGLSKVEAIRNALNLYLYVMKEINNGNRLVIVGKKEVQIKEIVLIPDGRQRGKS